MNKSKLPWALGIVLVLSSAAAISGVLDPDCDVEKAAKSTAMKATVGVGGRCSPKEAATDMTKDAVGIEDKGPVEKRRDDDGAAKKATKAIRH
jgi:hypothetical protein